MTSLLKMTTFISASDLEKYAYCPLSWWLSKKERNIVCKKGIEEHAKMGKELEEIRKKEVKKSLYEKWVLFFATAASIVAVAGIAFLAEIETGNTNKYIFTIFSLLWLLNSSFFLYKAEKIDIAIMKPRYERIVLISAMGALFISFIVILTSLPKNEGVSKFLEILSLLWIIFANIFFYYSLYISENILRKKIKYAKMDENIAYVGGRDNEEFISEKYGLRGKPDYVIEKEGEFIPVEEKTGRVPKGPLFSHMIQIIVYCMLIEDVTEKKPSYGILKYNENIYRITYDENLKEVVLQLRDNILHAIEKGEVHRNHDRRGKCINCSRREICPERLA
ncbi:MAG: Dna2/Cas4 domain-containing protein [Thermoplasmata archaeon]|nr:MAG: Dna2/Cas4 domain-containing protein [Thermoplasmata archaeon]